MSDKSPTPKQQYMIDQVVATLAIEDIELTQQGCKNIELILTGEMTADEAVADTIRRYFHGKYSILLSGLERTAKQTKYRGPG